jgi:long-chain fatty acid transport protein
MISRRTAPFAGALLGLGLCALGATEARASGFQLAEQSAKGLGNAFAGGAAIADDPSTIFYNTAGMTRLEGTQVSGTVSFIFPSGQWKDRGSTDAFGSPLTGSNGADGGVTAIVPVFYAMYAIDEQWRVGLGVTVPFGLATEWTNTWKGRYQAIKSDIKTINVQPSVAYRIDDQWSVGAGVNYQFLDVKLTQAIDYGTTAVAALGPGPAGALGLSPQGNDGRGIVEGDDWSWGFNAGVLFEMNEDTRFGFHWRSKIDHRVTGDGKFTIPEKAKPLQGSGAFFDTDVVANVTLPETINLSGAHALDEDWTVMGDIQWTRWSRLEELVIDYKNPAQPNSGLDLKYDDTFKIAAGADYRYSDVLTLRFGWAFDQDPTKRETRSPRLPTNDRHWLSVGFTYQVEENMTLDFGYTHIFLKDGKVDQTGTFGERVVGKSESKVDIFAIGGTLKF